MLLECAAVFVHLGHRRLTCLPLLRFVRQLALLGGQCLRLRLKACLRFHPLLPPLHLGLRALRQLGF